MAFISPGIATAASFSRRAAAAISFRRHRSYGFGAPAAAALFARRLIWLVYLVGLVCLIGLVYLVGLFVGWSIGLSGWSGVCGLGSVGLVCLIYRSGLEVGLSGWSGLSIAVSVGLLVWVTIVVTHGDLATDSSIKIFAGCWFG